MQVGDSLLSVAGVGMDDSDGLSNLGRAEVGETRAYVVDRGGQETTLQVEFTTLPGSDALANYVGLLVGALFVGMGLWAYFTVPNAGTMLLAIMGCGLGLALLSGPNLGPGMPSRLGNLMQVMGLALGFAVLLDFVIRSGRKDGYEQGGGGPRWLYWPALLVALMFAVLIVVQPDTAGLLNTVIQIVLGAFFLLYFGGSLLMVVRNYAKAEAGLRGSRSLGLMLAGAALGWRHSRSPS